VSESEGCRTWLKIWPRSTGLIPREVSLTGNTIDTGKFIVDQIAQFAREKKYVY
jgi:hypothetical protein